MKSLTPLEARELAQRAVELTRADQAEVIVTSHDSALTRFAGNQVHQNVAECDTAVAVRAVVGTRTGTASTNRIDDAGLRACCEAAVISASAAPHDPGFPGLPSPNQSDPVGEYRVAHDISSFDAEARASVAGSIIGQSMSRSLEAAGTVSVSEQTVAVANSKGIDNGMSVSAVRATVLSADRDGGSGWASYCGAGPLGLDAEALGDTAATLARRSANARPLDPGTYTVVLAPEAVATLLDFLGYAGLSARSVEEGRSFLSGRIGDRIVSEAISISDDATAPERFGLAFDYEGVRKSRVPLIEAGVARSPVTDSYWAARTGRPNTGHALPAPNPHGPLPLDLEMAPGDAAIEELIASVERGVYVTRFHYVNIEDPIPVTLTGMTRDGTFLIENGELSEPLNNLRFTQGVIAALGAVGGISHERRFFDAMLGTALTPALLLEQWEFTGQTE